MGYRIGQLAGLLTFGLLMGRLGRLLQTGPTEPAWNLILAAAAFLGAVTWWLLGQTGARRLLKISIFFGAGLLLTFRIAAPDTLFAGVIPTGATLTAMGEHLDLAFRIIRSGVPPVAANPGLMAILSALMWTLGALYTWGATGGPYAAMFLPSLIVYLQFAVFDRVQAGLGWLLVSALAIGLSMVSLALERKSEVGRARDTAGRPMGRRSVALAAVLAALVGVGSIVVADNAAALISEYGNAPWRGGGVGGYGDGVGGSQFTRLVDLRQRVLNLSETPVFVATFSADGPPPARTYWSVETLDQFDGVEWSRSDLSLERFQPGRPLANEYDTYQGTTSDFLQVVRIQNLAIDVAPTAGVPVDILDPPDGPNGRRPTEFQVLSDSAIVADGGLREGDEYQVRAVAHDQTADYGILASDSDGQLTPMFAAAAEAGEFTYEPGTTDVEAVRPPDLDRYIELPLDMPPSIRNLALNLTRRASTDFEAAWILHAWFRENGGFTYSTDVSTGHDALRLDDWLTDRESLNWRTGYCEQFAAAFAVMARTLEIPSRVVWGFTPGEVITRGDGNSQIVVRETNAHAWVELWMEPFGWVAFDPTPRSDQTDFPNQPDSITAGFDPADFLPETEIDPANAPTQGPEFLGDPEFAETPTDSAATSGPSWWIVVIGALMVLAGVIPLAKRLRRRRRLARVREGDITAAWDEIVDRLIDLGTEVPETITPMELARRSDVSLVPLASSYASTIYGGRSGQAQESDLLGAEWWIERTFDSRSRLMASMSARSLIRRR